jgi:ATP-dependent DNA helicase RecG
MDNMPFELTKGQKDAIRDIERDMAAQRPMNRLLEGDVGSGKTVVAAYALVLTVQNGLQGAFMAPTEVLAGQHYRTLSRLLLPLGVNIAFLSSALDRAAKEKVLEEVKDGMVDLVVGTHALIEETVEFKALGLAVIDEQHKFGVAQRALLRQKGRSPHVLVMTATPIPRTLALTVYGDLDISVIRELPKGRQPIATYWVEEAKRERIYSFIEEELAKGRQAYIVYPRIEESEEKGMRSARRMYETLAKGHFRTYRLGLLHGKMSSKDKDSVMADFKNGEIDILVATVVIEVGIDVPNASVMLIENAERFGLAQLHQLRGRIGRGDHESYCILLADPKTENAKARLKAIEETVDGFEIAEEDLDLRGPGEFFGTSQHGLPEIRFGNIIKDFAIMKAARDEAFGMIGRDPELKEERHRLLRDSFVNRFRGRLDFARTG